MVLFSHYFPLSFQSDQKYVRKSENKMEIFRIKKYKQITNERTRSSGDLTTDVWTSIISMSFLILSTKGRVEEEDRESDSFNNS